MIPVKKLYTLFIIGACLFFCAYNSFAENQIHAQKITGSLQLLYPKARIEIESPINEVLSQSSNSEINLLRDTGNGRAVFRISKIQTTGEAMVKEVEITFHAWMSAPIPVQRIRPLEKLKKEMFAIREIDLSRGQAYQYRSLILDSETDVSQLEALQTILPEQYPLLTSVRKTPNIKRGDGLAISVVSDGLRISTRGTSQQDAYIGDEVRVISQGTKTEMRGKLAMDGHVEVRF